MNVKFTITLVFFVFFSLLSFSQSGDDASSLVSDETFTESEEQQIQETDKFTDYVIKTYGEIALKEAAKFGVTLATSKMLECAMQTPAGQALVSNIESKVADIGSKVSDKVTDIGQNIPMFGAIFNAAAGSEYDVIIARWAKLCDDVKENTQKQTKLHESTLAKFADGVKTGNKILDIATDLYHSYQTVVSYMETVNEAVEGAKEVKQLKEYAERIMNLYDEYGVTFGKNGLYELDKYLNPSQQKRYIALMQSIIDDVQYVLQQAAYVCGTKSLGVSYSDHWRLTEFRNLLLDMQRLENDMYHLIYTTMYLCQINMQNDQFVDCMERCWNFWDYDTYSVW